MTLAGMVWRNLFRRRTRTLLTVLGISVGIAAVVALTGFARGLERGWRDAYEARGTDLVVTKITSRSPLPAPFEHAALREFLESPAIEASAGLLSDMMGIEDSPAVLVFGWELPSFLWEHLRFTDGRAPQGGAAREAALGKIAASSLGKKTGDPIQIEFEEFRVSGIFESPALVENGAVILPLEQMQAATGRAGKVNFLNLRLKERETGAAEIKARLGRLHQGFSALDSAEVASRNSGIEIARAMSWATSLLALFVGMFGVTNTMLMSVFERVREIGILLAIGWRRRRVMAMILLESLFLSLLGGALGLAGGIAAATALGTSELLRGRLEAEIGPGLFLTAMGLSVALGLLAGIYPAWRASRLQPGEALRAE